MRKNEPGVFLPACNSRRIWDLPIIRELKHVLLDKLGGFFSENFFQAAIY